MKRFRNNMLCYAVMLFAALCALTANAQGVAVTPPVYDLAFKACGDYETIDEVTVENTTQGVEVKATGSDIVRLTSKPDAIESATVGNGSNVLLVDGRLAITLMENTKVAINVYSVSGMRLSHWYGTLYTGSYTTPLPGLSNEVCIVKVQMGNETKSFRYHSSNSAIVVRPTPTSSISGFRYATPLSETMTTRADADDKKKVVELLFNEGDRLRITAKSGKACTILFKEPTVSQNVVVPLFDCTIFGRDYTLVAAGGSMWTTEDVLNADGTAAFTLAEARAAMPENFRLPLSGQLDELTTLDVDYRTLGLEFTAPNYLLRTTHYSLPTIFSVNADGTFSMEKEKGQPTDSKFAVRATCGAPTPYQEMMDFIQPDRSNWHPKTESKAPQQAATRADGQEEKPISVFDSGPLGSRFLLNVGQSNVIYDFSNQPKDAVCDVNGMTWPQNGSLAGGFHNGSTVPDLFDAGVPLFSNRDADDEWKYIVFCHGNLVMEGYGIGDTIRVADPAERESQLWRKVGTDDCFMLENKAGGFAILSDGPHSAFVLNEEKGTQFKQVKGSYGQFGDDCLEFHILEETDKPALNIDKTNQVGMFVTTWTAGSRNDQIHMESAPYWYHIQFNNEGRIIEGKGVGNNILVGNYVQDKDAQLWCFEGDQYCFRLRNKAGGYAYLGGDPGKDPLILSNDKATEFRMVKCKHNQSTNGWEIQILTDTEYPSLNMYTGNAVGNYISTWKAGDINCCLVVSSASQQSIKQAAEYNYANCPRVMGTIVNAEGNEVPVMLVRYTPIENNSFVQEHSSNNNPIKKFGPADYYLFILDGKHSSPIKLSEQFSATLAIHDEGVNFTRTDYSGFWSNYYASRYMYSWLEYLQQNMFVGSFDYDGDGIEDLVVKSGKKCCIFSGTEGTGELLRTVEGLSPRMAFTTGDYNNDGRKELLYANVAFNTDYDYMQFAVKEISKDKVGFISDGITCNYPSKIYKNYYYISGSNGFSDIAVGDVDGDGKNEIVVKGFYDLDPGVTTLHPNDPDYIDYDYAASPSRHIAVFKHVPEGFFGPNGKTYVKGWKSFEDVPAGLEFLMHSGLKLAKFRGAGVAADIIGSKGVWRYNGNTGNFECVHTFAGFDFKYNNSNQNQYCAYIPRQCVAIGNFNNNDQGKEQMIFGRIRNYEYYTGSAADYNKTMTHEMEVRRLEVGGNGSFQTTSLGKKDVYSNRIYRTNNKKNFLNWDKTIITFPVMTSYHSEPTREYKFVGYTPTLTEPNIIAMLAAPPHWADYDYEDSQGTSWGNSFSTGTGKETSYSNSASLIVGYEQEINIGFIKAGGIDFEMEMKSTISGSTEQTRTETFSQTYTTFTSDVVVLTATPYDTYSYVCTSCEQPDYVGTEMQISIPRRPLTFNITLPDYTRFRADNKELPDLRKVFDHTVGDPNSYHGSVDYFNKQATGKILWGQNDPNNMQSTGSGGKVSRTIELSEETSQSAGFEFEVSSKLVGSMAGAKLGAGYSHSTGSSHSTSYGKGFQIGADVLDPRNISDLKRFSWNVCWYKMRFGGQEFNVVNYRVQPGRDSE